MKYEELINALRYCIVERPCSLCPRYEEGTECFAKLHRDAASAIEALEAEVEKWTYNATLEQSKAIANFESYCKLKEQMPKRGKWEPFDKTKVRCTSCRAIFGNAVVDLYKYCPMCGSDNGAKMEVQE